MAARTRTARPDARSPQRVDTTNRTEESVVNAPAEDIVVVRVFDAPRELVWKAWSEPQHFQRWWGPKGFTSPSATMDFRVGGRYHWCMRSPDGREMWTTGVYREIITPQRLVYTDSPADAHGNAVPPSYLGMPGDTIVEGLVTVTLDDEGGKTKLTLRHAGLPSAWIKSAAGGWNQTFDKLAASLAERRLAITLPSDTEIMMTRTFDAPRQRVFEAHSTAEHVRRWWGPREFEMTVCDMDFRPGGKWRFVQTSARGEFGFRGEYREISPPDRIVWTFEYEGAPGEIAVETLTLTERNGRTTLTTRSVFPSRAARDAMIESGMEKGAAETWDRLAEHLRSMRTRP